jgi:hypothetical protein
MACSSLTSNSAFPLQGSTCIRAAFSLDCFRDQHFHWCRFHKRIIRGGMRTCHHADKADCMPIFWGTFTWLAQNITR